MSFQPKKNSSYDDGNNENGEDSISSGGSDWSTYVNYLSRTPERSSSPVLAEDDSKPEVKIEVDVPSVLSGLNLQPAGQAADKPVNKPMDKAVIDLEAQVPTSSAPPGHSNSSKSARVAVPVYPILPPRVKTKLQPLVVKTGVKGPPALLAPNQQKAGEAADKPMDKAVIDRKAQVPTTSAPPRDEPPPTPGHLKSSKSARVAVPVYPILAPRLKTKLQALLVKTEVKGPPALSVPNQQPAGQAADKRMNKSGIDLEAQVPTTRAPPRDESPPTPGHSKTLKSARAAAQPYSIPTPRSTLGTVAGRRAVQLVPPNSNLANRLDLESISREIAMRPYPILTPAVTAKLEALMKKKSEVKEPPALSVPNQQKAGEAADKPVDKAVIDPEAQVPTTSAPPPTPAPSKSSKSARAAAQPYSIPTPRSTLRTVAGRRAVPSNSNLANRLNLESISKAIAVRPYPILTPAVKAKLEALMKKKKTEVNGPPALSVPNQQKAGEAADKPVDKAVINPETQVPTTSAAPRDEPPPTPGHSKSSQSARAAVQPYRIVTLRSPLRTAAGRRPVQLVPSNSDLATQLDLESISRAVEECGARPVTDTRSEHPLAISQYFNSLSRHIISSRISRARYLWLRHQIIRSVLLALEDPDMPTTTSLFKPF